MRCHVRIKLGKTGYRETYCYEPLAEDGTCSQHGQQAIAKPEWMSDEQFKAALSNLHRQAVVVRRSRFDTPNGGTQSDSE